MTNRLNLKAAAADIEGDVDGADVHLLLINIATAPSLSPPTLCTTRQSSSLNQDVVTSEFTSAQISQQGQPAVFGAVVNITLLPD